MGTNIAKSILVLCLLVFLLPNSAFASPNEASGVVTNVVDGDTFDIRIEDTDPRITQSIERIRLADVDSPEMSTSEGPLAKLFATTTLLNNKVWLDIDDRSADGRGPYGRLICVVYLTESDGLPMISPCFNRMLVDFGYADVDDYYTNEFNPDMWWDDGTPGAVQVQPQESTTTTGEKYVGSKKSDKYHYPDCRWAKKILPENEIWFSSSDEARAAGYVPCGVCNPP